MILNRKIIIILALLSILLIIPASFAEEDIDACESQEISDSEIVTLETGDVTNTLSEKSSVVYVNSSASSTGSGTASNPVKTIQEGLNLVDDGGIIYLTGKFIGDGNSNITLKSVPDKITFIGVGGTTIDGDHANTFAVVNNGTYTFRDLVFANHYKTGNEDEFGGVICNEKGKLSFYSCTFENNTVYGVNNANGSAIDSARELNVIDCVFKNNTADNSNSSGYRKNAADGGAISNIGQLYISNTAFNGNTALRNGGALRIQESKSVIIRNCNFTDNRAAYHLSGGSFGGAIYTWDCGMNIYNSIFKNNRVYALSGSGAQGGAISSDRSSDKINIQSCQFINNTAGGTTTVSGQCFYFGSVDVDMNYCTIDTGLYSASQSVNLNYNWWDANNIYDLIENLPSTTGIKTYAELKVTSDAKDIQVGDLINITVKLQWNEAASQSINLIPQRTVYLDANCGVLGSTSGDLSNGEFKTTLKISSINNAMITATVDDVVYYLNLSKTTDPTKFSVAGAEIVEGEEAILHIIAEENETGYCLIDIDGVTYYAELVKGIATAIIPNLDVGNHDFFVKYIRSDLSNPYNATAGITVKVDPSSKTYITVSPTATLTASDTAAGEKGGFLYVTLKDSNGTAIADKTIQAALNGKIYKITTDSQGKAALQISLSKANTYNCAFAFLGDSKYPASDLVISKLTVTKKSTSLSASVKSNKVTITLKTSKNKYDSKKYLNKGKKITLKVKGKTYSLKTNAKGIVKFTLKLAKGTYTVKISFTGDSTYKSSAKTVKIRIR